MKRKFAVILVLIFVITCIFEASGLTQPSLFLWGNVRWNTGYPAIKVEVRLIQVSTQKIVASSYTNETGRYAFFGIGGQPSDYSLQVYTGKYARGGTALSVLPAGGAGKPLTSQFNDEDHKRS